MNKSILERQRGKAPMEKIATKSHLLLAIDIGNTNICLGIFKGKKLLYSWRLTTNKEITPDEYGLKILTLFQQVNLQTRVIKDIIISNVVPPLTSVFEGLSKKYFHCQPLIVTAELKTELKILYKNPQEIGADRIVNAVAGYSLFGGPLIIVDFGTATTFDCVTEKGEYIGGAIAPGINISAEALYTHTAKLPRVGIIKPERVIGKNTVESMQSGIFYGYIGLVEELVRQCKKEMKNEKTKVIATGGLAELITSGTKVIEKVVPELTLKGLQLIWEYNKK